MNRSARQQQLLDAKRSYSEKPMLRRAKTCESVLGGAAMAAFVVLFGVVQAARFVANETFGWVLIAIALLACVGFVGAVLFVSFLTLTGPIYKQQLDFKKGDLETWGIIDRLAAGVLSLLAILAAVYVVYRFVL